MPFVGTLAAASLLMTAATPEEIALFDERSVVVADRGKDETFKYRLLKPAAIEPGKTYPVILFLHGAGERGDDNVAQLKHFPDKMVKPANREKFPCFLVAPQCRKDKKWVDVDWSDPKGAPQPKEPSLQMRAAVAALDDVLKNFPVDTTRVYLTGLSMGGYGSWDLGTRQPERFAAIAPICGGGDPAVAGKLVGKPVWAWHGDEDKAVPVERSRKMIAAIKEAAAVDGRTPPVIVEPKYAELPGVGHNSWDAAYGGPENLLPWLFEQKLPAAKCEPVRKVSAETEPERFGLVRGGRSRRIVRFSSMRPTMNPARPSPAEVAEAFRIDSDRFDDREWPCGRGSASGPVAAERTT